MKKDSMSNKCKNCAHFIRHYANLRGKYFLVSGCLHCINSNLTLSEIKRDCITKKFVNIGNQCNYKYANGVKVLKKRCEIFATIWKIYQQY